MEKYVGGYLIIVMVVVMKEAADAHSIRVGQADMCDKRRRIWTCIQYK